MRIVSVRSEDLFILLSAFGVGVGEGGGDVVSSGYACQSQ